MHIVFDNPGRQPASPKALEHKRRDDSNVLSHDHKHVRFTAETTVPTRWRDQCLSCRECKRNLVLYLGEYFLDNAVFASKPTEASYSWMLSWSC